MKKFKVLSLLLVVMLTFTMIPSSVAFANDFTVVSTSPVDGEKDVSVLEDVTITFSSEVDRTTITSENVIISGGNVSFTVLMQSDTVVVLDFENAFDFETTYTIQLTSNIVDMQGAPLTQKEISFMTERNPITFLFEEDFSGDPVEALARFEDVGRMDPIGESYGVIDNTLSITADAFHLDDYPDLPEGHPRNGWESRPILKIKGSENWSDYELKYDTCRHDKRSWGNVVFRLQNDKNLYETRISADHVGKGADAVHMRKLLTGVGEVILSTTEKGNFFSRGKFYPGKLTVIGSNFTHTIDTEEGVKTINASATELTGGSIGFSSMRYTARFDNIVVYDKGFLFTPSVLKNTQDVITLNFNDSIDFDTVEGNVAVSDINGPVSFNTSPNGLKGLDIQIEEAQLGAFYTITLGDEITNAAGTKSLTNEKTFNIKTAKQVNTFDVESTYPLNGEKDISILEDVTVEFTNSVDINTLTRDNIILSDDVPFSIMLKSPNKVTLSFDDGLDFNKIYDVLFTSGIKDIYGNSLPELTISFSTESDKLTLLFEEDFSGDPAEALARFEDVGRMDPIGESYGVIDNTLSITADAFHLDDYPDLPEGHPRNGWESRPILKIKGSENWSDYELKYDTCRHDKRSWGNVVFRLQNDKNLYETRISADHVGTGADAVHMRKLLTGVGEVILSTTEKGNFFSRGKFYPGKLTVIGSNFTHTIDTEEGVKTINASATELTGGSIGFSSMRYTARFDNIVVYDKGFLFTPSRVKNITNNLILDFNDDINFETISGKITVSNELGIAETIITEHGTKGISIGLVNPKSDTVYTVEVNKDIENLEGKTMTADKTFQFKTECSTVENMSIKSGTATIYSLAANTTIFASADISYYLSTGQQDYTLILAVYDNEGYLYDLSFEKETLYAGNSEPMPITTSGIDLPSNVTGYKARVFVLDNMINIKPVSTVLQIQ